MIKRLYSIMEINAEQYARRAKEIKSFKEKFGVDLQNEFEFIADRKGV